MTIVFFCHVTSHLFIFTDIIAQQLNFFNIFVAMPQYVKFGALTNPGFLHTLGQRTFLLGSTLFKEFQKERALR